MQPHPKKQQKEGPSLSQPTMVSSSVQKARIQQQIGRHSSYCRGNKTKVEITRAQPKKALRHDEEEPERKDRLSMLPDDILVSIVERLDQRQAAAMGSLSSKWIHIPRMLSEVNLSTRFFIPYGAGYRLATTSCTAPQWRKLCRLEMQPGMTAFVRAIYHLLNSHFSNHKIKRLVLSFPLVSEGSTRRIATILKDAARLNRFDALEAHIDWKSHPTELGGLINLHTLVRQFNSALGCLTKLTLSDFDIGSRDLNYLLKLSPCLEALHLWDCSTTGCKHGVLEVDAPHSKLKDVLVERCRGLRRVQFLRVPQLERVVCDVMLVLSSRSTQRIKHVHTRFLVHRSSDFRCRIGEILTDPSRVEELWLGFYCSKVWIMPEFLSTPMSKLKKLFLYDIPVKHDLFWIAFLLQAAPFLEILRFNVRIARDHHKMLPETTLQWNGLSEFQHHHHLKELEMFGFRGYDRHMSFVRLVMKRAMALEIVTLHGNSLELYLRPNNISDYYRPFTREVEDWRLELVWKAHQKASLLEQLREGIFSTARVVVD